MYILQSQMHGGVNKLKHHDMRPCNKVCEDGRLECKEALINYKEQKTK